MLDKTFYYSSDLAEVGKLQAGDTSLAASRIVTDFCFPFMAVVVRLSRVEWTTGTPKREPRPELVEGSSD